MYHSHHIKDTGTSNMFNGIRQKKIVVLIVAVLILLTKQYSKISAENKTVTIIIGEGHEVLAGSFIECVNEDYREIVFAERENEESNTVVLNVFNGNIGTKGVIDLSNDTLNKILGESKKDNDQKFYITALKEFAQYQDKNEVEEEYKTLDEAELENGDVFYVLWEEETKTTEPETVLSNTENTSYKIAEGYDNMNWLAGSTVGLEFYFVGDEGEEIASEKLDYISIDGEPLDETDYTSSGSLYIRLTSAYLNTLTEGKHTLKAFFTDGKNAESDFNVRTTDSNDLPIMIINITNGSIEKMNDDQEHKTGCSGTLDIRFPEDYSYIEKPGLVITDQTNIAIEEIRGRGNSSWRMPKKPFKIKLEKKTDLFAMGENKHWVLLANYMDKTLLKDRIVANLSDQLGFEFTPECVNVEVYMNDTINGRQYYLGNYMLAEQVRLGKNRLNINELEEDDVDEKKITGGYLIQGGQQRYLSSDVFRTTHGLILANDIPSFDTNDGGYENEIQMNYIRDHIQKVEDALYADDFTGKDGLDYSDYIDMNSAVDYFLLNEVMVNEDAYGTGSHYFYKVSDTFNEDGTLKSIGKIYYGPIWDYDKCLGPDKTDSVYPDSERYSMLEKFCLDDAWYKAMLRDPRFLSQVKERWNTLKQLLTSLIADGGLIDQYYQENRKSQTDDYAYWFSGKENVYAQEITDLKNRIAHRISYVDEHINDLDNVIHKVDFIIDGKVDQRKYCRDKDYVQIYIPEKEGYIFLGWLDENGKIIEEIDDTTYDRTFTASFVSKEEASKPDEIVFLMENVYGEPGGRIWARYTLFPEDAQDKSVIWSSSNEDVATVDEKGNVVLNKTGTTTITATLASGVKGSYKVTVVNDRPVYETFEIPDTLYINKGDHDHIEVKIAPEEGDYGYIVFASEDEEIASVDSNGVVKGLKTGQTYITITTDCYDSEKQEDIYVEKKCKVIVLQEGTYECINVSGKEWEKGNKDGMTFVFRRSADEDMTYDLFEKLTTDGTDVGKNNYVKTKGSVIIRLKASYLETLSAGKHELKAHFLDKGEVSIEITIKEKTRPAYIIPVTGIEE